jgi:hypothetical protein
MSFLVKVGRVVLILIGTLIVFDLIGVVACFVFDVMPFRGNSSLLPFAVWFVLGVFSGFLSYNFSGKAISPKSDKDWTNLPEALRLGRFVVIVSGIALVGFCGAFYALWWQHPMEGSSFVPDSAPVTLTFLSSAFVAMVAARALFMPRSE